MSDIGINYERRARQNERARNFKPGQRVLAIWRGGSSAEKRLGVVSSEVTSSWQTTVSVQFSPCDAHWHCNVDDVSAYGDANGWTDAEYRVERERAYCVERARTVERERRERYPDAPFSAFS